MEKCHDLFNDGKTIYIMNVEDFSLLKIDDLSQLKPYKMSKIQEYYDWH